MASDDVLFLTILCSLFKLIKKVHESIQTFTTTMEEVRCKTHSMTKQVDTLTGNSRLHVKIVGNLFLIWLDENIDDSISYCYNGMLKLSQIANVFKVYIDRDQSVDFLTDIQHENVYFLISEEM